MSKQSYKWVPGDPPPRIGRHSLAKHEILKSYLEKYVAVLTARLPQEKFKLTLVDGFAGGGVYLHPDADTLVYGSPFIMLDAMCAAAASAQNLRTKPFLLDVEYFFVEKSPKVAQFLENELRRSENAQANSESIHVLKGCFSLHLPTILQRIEERGRSRRVIFVLDQYGYSDVRMADLRTIFQRLPNAEVIVTIAVDWLIDYCADTSHYAKVVRALELDGAIPEMIAMKQANPADWRPVIQHRLHQQLHQRSGAIYYTPFFVFSTEAHRAYWLMHFSGHSKARDVMTQLHWELSNHFQHFGAPGFCMLGHDPRKDFERLGQRRLPFGFDKLAAEETRCALMEDIPRRIASYKDGITLRVLATT